MRRCVRCSTRRCETVTNPIQVGDVCLDLAQGRPVHVVEDCGQTAAEWSDANNYELTENYGNGRLGASDGDAVYEVVYCSSAKSEPSKTYAMPESRLLRIETEAADNGRPVADRVARNVLESLFAAAHHDDALDTQALKTLAYSAGIEMALVDEAAELADVERTVASDD
jgi:hypothetical protein